MIDAKRFYSLGELAENPIFKEKGTFSPKKLKGFVMRKKLKANIFGVGNGRRYYVRGDWAIEFLAKFEDGSL